MKIALVAQDDSALGQRADVGDSVQLTELTSSLAARGHEVTVYTRKPGDGTPLNDVSAFAGSLRDSWRGKRPDVVHALRWTSGLAALAAARGLGIPVVQSFQSLGIAEKRHKIAPGTIATERIRLEPAIGRSAAAVVASNSDQASDLTQLGVPRKSIKVVPCGIDTGQFAPEGPVASRNGRPRLLTVADLAAGQRGLDTLLRALSRVPDAELVIAGGPPRGRLSSDKGYQGLAGLAGSLGVGDRVVFAGGVPRPELPALLRSADLLVHASSYEPTGIMPLQAMACGTPVVACGGGGALTDAVVDGTTGILVPPGRPALLAQRIRALLAHPMLLEAYGVAAADRARSRYSWDRIASETLAVYDGACETAIAA